MNLLAIFCVLISGLRAALSSEAAYPEDRSLPFYSYDDYESCKNPALYCIVKVVTGVQDAGTVSISTRILANEQPNIRAWGVCIPKCRKELAVLNRYERRRLNVQTVNVTDKTEKLAKQCVGNRLHKQYSILGYVHVEYCESRDDSASKTTDWLGWLFIGICVASAVLTVYATVKHKPGQPHIAKGTSLMQAFSFKRNWATFLHLPDDKTFQDFQYLEGIRVFTCVAIIFVHIMYELLMLPVSNPEVLLQDSRSIWGRLGNILSPLPVQVFFTISGLLLAVNFLKNVPQRTRALWSFLAMKMVNRLIRLLPAYALWMLFTASWNGTLSHGPVAYFTLKAHTFACRKAWWANFLFFNNSRWMNYLCMEHAWYLGADMQMFFLALWLLTLVHSFPRSVWRCFIIASIVAILFPVTFAYLNALDPVFAFQLEEVLNGSYQYAWIRKLYMPSYTNLTTYLAGIVAGYSYVSIIYHNQDYRDTKTYKVIRCLSVFLLLSTPLASLMWFYVDYDSTSIWPALFNGFGKSYVPLFMAVCFIEGIGRPAGLVRSFLGRPIFVVLGKLCYAVYIVQYSVVKFLFSRDDPNWPVDYGTSITRVLPATLISFGLALMIYLYVELPVGVYLKAKLMRSKKRSRVSIRN